MTKEELNKKQTEEVHGGSKIIGIDLGTTNSCASAKNVSSIKRGIFSNEAALGSAPSSHSSSAKNR